MKSILDRSFRYTPSVETDLRKTFARIRRRQKEEDSAQTQDSIEASPNVLSLDLKKLGSAASLPKSL